MIEFTPEQLASRIIDLGLAPMAEVEAARSEVGTGESTIQDFINILHGKGLLTNLQLDKLRRGERSGYFYGKYKVMYLIGAGTFARVYRAAHRETNQVVALKVLRKRYRDEVAQMEQFLREGRMGLRLRHPNIVSIYEVDPNVKNPFMVMEFVEGETLRDLVRIRGKLQPEVAMKLLVDIASGLSYAASLGISHRDLKLSNVLVSSEGRAKLVDFGLAALADRENPEKVADCPNARAIDYAALERGTNVRKDDPRSDVFFAGAMLYTMLCGEPPLTETRERMKRLNVGRFQDIKPIGQIDPTLPVPAIQVVAKALEFDPEKRLQSAAALQLEGKQALERMKQIREGGPAVAAKVASGEMPTNEGEGRFVMLVESKASLQDVVRDRLKKRGYRVLVISDPVRALGRFVPGDDPPADCVIFSASELGSLALEAFNRFASDEHTADIPAVLLADKSQQNLIRQAKMAPHRVLLSMPLKVLELRTALRKLLAGRPKREEFI
ncbi:Serine/threonine-protein kinase PK-1 [Rosistilla oblonga]|uniref:non-specific serine/threonine protein kinase n=1 Tax=Rosistilla oblonga TaxID=2527990 RepID=A0A518IWE7_9BACT|nr:serine/threonine-protein kinase [Rosistilla oblonga]QDV14450.1 Serine/threonine-protein kinase PK-1 [Rosistilla oblonga]QDV57418.1 Serine/threonine-protein kinase PK-1 [Rosistilla oblonga]